MIKYLLGAALLAVVVCVSTSAPAETGATDGAAAVMSFDLSGLDSVGTLAVPVAAIADAQRTDSSGSAPADSRLLELADRHRSAARCPIGRLVGGSYARTVYAAGAIAPTRWRA